MADVRLMVDVMGADGGPGPLIAGVIDALMQHPDLHCTVAVTPAAIDEHCAGRLDDRFALHLVDEVIEMDDDPSVAVRSKRRSSLVQSMQMGRQGGLDAVVTAANTGAVVLAASALLRRLPAIAHPALATPLRHLGASPKILIDCGAAARRDPTWLEHHAYLGAALGDALFLEGSQSVGLLANGAEAFKGDDAIREAHRRLEASDSAYVGLVEPDAFYAPSPDVIVTDGLTGNLVLKTIEATFRAIQTEFDGPHPTPQADDLGSGAILVGVDGVVVKAHGAGTRRGIARAITLARRCVIRDVHAHLRNTFSAGRARS